MLRKVQPDKARVRKGTGLYGLDKTGKRRVSSVDGGMHRRNRELLCRYS